MRLESARPESTTMVIHKDSRARRSGLHEKKSMNKIALRTMVG
jgi:hypothetical protein